MEARLLDQQQVGHRDDCAREREPPESREHAGCDHHQRRDLGGRLDVVPARRDVARQNESDRGPEQDRGERGKSLDPQAGGNAGESPEQREGTHAAKARLVTTRVPRPLPLDADRGSAERGHGDLDDPLESEQAAGGSVHRRPKSEITISTAISTMTVISSISARAVEARCARMAESSWTTSSLRATLRSQVSRPSRWAVCA